jgi:cell shape-determining protein MreD
VLYCVIFLFFYILQTMPGFLTIRGVKPIWVIPAAIALAMFEGEFLGGVYGALAGLLCDMGGFLLFGFNGFFTCLYCVAVGLLVIYLMHNNLLGCMLVVLIFMILRGSLEFLFAYGMWGYENVWKLYVYQTLPVAVYSTVISAVPYFLFRALHRRLKGSS